MRKIKLDREIEKLFKVKKGTLKNAVSDLRTRHKKTDEEIVQIAEQAVAYCNANNQGDGLSYCVALNLYVSCLNNPKREKAA